MMRAKFLLLLLGFMINSVALSSDSSGEDFLEDLNPTLKRTVPDEPSKSLDEAQSKRAKMEEFPILEKAIFAHNLSRLVCFDNVEMIDTESQQEFKQISRETHKGIYLLTGQGDTNKKILNLLSPQDVKSVMLTCRRGYWLGRTRGFICLADPDRVKQDLKSLFNFMDAMVSDPAFPVITLDVTKLERPAMVFEQLLLRKKLKSLTAGLKSYTWRNKAWMNRSYTSYTAYGVIDPIPAQLEMLSACSELRYLSLNALDQFKPSVEHSYDTGTNDGLRLAAEREYQRIISLTTALKNLEVFRCGLWRMPKSHLHAVLRGFKNLKVLDYLSSGLFSIGENPFRVLADEDDPQSGMLSFPCLQEIVIDGKDSHDFDTESLISSLQLCANLRRLDFCDFITGSTTLFAAHQAFLNSQTLEIVNIALRDKGKQIFTPFTLSRKGPDGALQLSSSKSFLFPSPRHVLEFFATLRSEFPLEQYPDVVVKDVTLLYFTPDREHRCSRDELIQLGDTISHVQVLHLPRLGDYPMKTLVAFLEKLPYLVELDLSESYKHLPDSVYIYAAGRVKHLDISGRDKIHPELIRKILSLRNLKSLAISYIKERMDRKIRPLIDKTMVEGWRAEFPETEIIVPQETTIITEKRPRKAKV